jgi:hypothetical protein
MLHVEPELFFALQDESAYAELPANTGTITPIAKTR